MSRDGRMADVKYIWGFDTWGEPSVEASSVGATAGMANTWVHANDPIQDYYLELGRNLTTGWLSNTFTVSEVEEDFCVGFWIYIDNANMGVVGDQDILKIYTDGGTTADITINHSSGYPTAGAFDWRIMDSAGVQQGTLTQPFAEDEWRWCKLWYHRDASAGSCVLGIYNDYPATTLYKTLILGSEDFEGSAGSQTTGQLELSGHIAAPAGGSMVIGFGGAYFADDCTLHTDALTHQEFLSLRPDKASATPDCDETGGNPAAGDDLVNSTTWDDAGDEATGTRAEYLGATNAGGAVQTEDYDLATKIINGHHDVAKYLYDLAFPFRATGKYVYGFYDNSAGTYSVATGFTPSSRPSRRFEKVIYAGDAQWPVFSNNSEIRATPVIGFQKVAATSFAWGIEMAHVTMWPKGSPGNSDTTGEHHTQILGQAVGRGIAV